MKTKLFGIPYSSYLAVVMMVLAVGVSQPMRKKLLAAAKKNPKPIPPALWVFDGSGDGTKPSISAFKAGTTYKKTGTVGSSGIAFPGLGTEVRALTFDSHQNLWISFCAGDTSPGQVIELGAAGLKSQFKGASPEVIIGDPSAGLATLRSFSHVRAV